MKSLVRILGLIAILAVFVCGLVASAPAFGVTLMAAPTLATQKIVFLTSLKEEYNGIDTWMKKAENLDAFVSKGQKLIFPEGGSDPTVYKNRVIDVDSVEPTETTHEVELDVYDSQNYKLRNIYLHALPFDKIKHYTKKSADAIVRQELADTAYAWAPATEGNKRIVIPTTGAAVGGLKTLTLADIMAFAVACDNAEFPEGRNIVLPSNMWWQLVNSNDILKAQLSYQVNNGVIEPKVVSYYGFEIHKSMGDKLGIAWDISAAEKAAQGAAIAGDVVPAALMFCNSEVFTAGGSMEMFYSDKSSNPEGRAYTFGFQHRFKSDFQMSSQRYSGLIYAAQ